MAVLWWDEAEWFSALIAAVFAAVTLGALLLELSHPDELRNWSFASLARPRGNAGPGHLDRRDRRDDALPTALCTRAARVDLAKGLAVIGKAALLVFGILGFALGLTAGRLAAVRRVANALLALVWFVPRGRLHVARLAVRAFQAAALVLALLSARAVGLGEGRLTMPVTFAGNSARRRAALTITSVFFVAVVAVVAVASRRRKPSWSAQVG